MAYSLVTLYGMSDKVGHLSFPPPQDGRMQTSRPYSEETAEKVDQEVREIVNAAFDRTVALLTEKRDLAEKLALRLLEKEVIHREDVVECLGERPWRDASTYAELVAGNVQGTVNDDA